MRRLGETPRSECSFAGSSRWQRQCGCYSGCVLIIDDRRVLARLASQVISRFQMLIVKLLGRSSRLTVS